MQIELLKFPYSYMEYEKILQIRELKVLLPEIEVLSDDKHMLLDIISVHASPTTNRSIFFRQANIGNIVITATDIVQFLHHMYLQ